MPICEISLLVVLAGPRILDGASLRGVLVVLLCGYRRVANGTGGRIMHKVFIKRSGGLGLHTSASASAQLRAAEQGTSFVMCGCFGTSIPCGCFGTAIPASLQLRAAEQGTGFVMLGFVMLGFVMCGCVGTSSPASLQLRAMEKGLGFFHYLGKRFRGTGSVEYRGRKQQELHCGKIKVCRMQ